MKRLEFIAKKDTKAVVICTLEPLYKYLIIVTKNIPWINVILIDTCDISKIKLRYFWKILYAKKLIKEKYRFIFEMVPNNSIVHFYNRLANLVVGYWIWQLSEKCTIYYAECDPVDVYSPQKSILAKTKWLLLKIIYPIPFEMLHYEEGGIARVIPSLNKKFMDNIVDQELICYNDMLKIKESFLYDHFSTNCSAKIVWLTYPVLDSSNIKKKEYLNILSELSYETNILCQPEKQAVKYHPRTKIKEDIWDEKTQVIPKHIPAEFINWANLRVIITLVSTSGSRLGNLPGVKVISLIKLLPYTDDATRKQHRILVEKFSEDQNWLFPKSITDFYNLLKDIIG
jgi:hypothetical protein